MTQSAMHSRPGGAARKGTASLSASQLSVLREMLEQQRRFRLDQLEQLQAGDGNGRIGVGDTATKEIADSLTAGARAALRDVVDALQRMDDGRYGSCRRCGDALEAERLEVLPQISLCMACQRSEQHD